MIYQSDKFNDIPPRKLMNSPRNTKELTETGCYMIFGLRSKWQTPQARNTFSIFDGKRTIYLTTDLTVTACFGLL